MIIVTLIKNVGKPTFIFTDFLHFILPFTIKRKTRVFPYFIWVCKLFTTTLLIFLTTATWLSFLGFFTTSHSLISFKMGLLLPLYFSIFLLISSRVDLNVAPKVVPKYNFVIFIKIKRLSFPLYC